MTMLGRDASRLAEVLGGKEADCGGSRCWHVATALDQVAASAPQPHLLARPLRCEVAPGKPARVDPARTLVLDIETGGFAGTPIFLIGVVPLDARPLRVEQFLARDYPEEEAILRQFARLAHNRDTWVTFNGKSFDAPFVFERATIHSVRIRPPRIHVDLLHLARRRWRRQVPNCQLTTLERLVLGRTRTGDVGGSEIPDLFHYFVRTGNAGPLRPVLEHNRRDLLTGVELLLALAGLPIRR